jgi:hypothetical protein
MASDGDAAVSRGEAFATAGVEKLRGGVGHAPGPKGWRNRHFRGLWSARCPAVGAWGASCDHCL